MASHSNGKLRVARLENLERTYSDYGLSTFGAHHFLAFEPNFQNITVNFYVYGDNLPEEIEALKLSSTSRSQYSSSRFPTFQPPRTSAVFQSAEIRIIDDDCKLVYTNCCSVRTYMYLYALCFIAAVVGFEKLQYIVNENDGSQEVCVIITNPPPNEDLVYSIDLFIETE